MEPKIIFSERLFIAGLTGNGAETGKVWEDFDKKYAACSFKKKDQNGYEIRFYEDDAATLGSDIHVGFSVEENQDIEGFSMIELPSAEYAVFDVFVANGYDSENESINRWLEDNSATYGVLKLDGREVIVECYNEKFKDGDKADSVVEIWVPIYRICQSCSMPMIEYEDFGSEVEGNGKSLDYCCHCYGNGAFFKEETMEEMIESCIPFSIDYYESAENAREAMLKIFPDMKRWK